MVNIEISLWLPHVHEVEFLFYLVLELSYCDFVLDSLSYLFWNQTVSRRRELAQLVTVVQTTAVQGPTVQINRI